MASLAMRSMRSRLWGGVHPLLSLLLLPLLPLAACAVVILLVGGFLFSELVAVGAIALNLLA